MDGEAYVSEAYNAIFQGDFESAADWFIRATESDPDNASYYYKASITLARSGKLTDAERFARRAVELEPEDPAYAMHLNAIESRLLTAEAKRLLERDPPDAESARKLLLKAETLDPLFTEAKLLLGAASRLLGDWRSAVEYLREVLNMDPQHEEAGRLLREWRKERRRLVQSLFYHPKP